VQAIDDRRRREDADEQQATKRPGWSTSPGDGDQRPARGMRKHADRVVERQQMPRHEKKVPKEATAHPAAITSMTNGTGGDDPAIARLRRPAVNPNRPPAQIRRHDDAGIGQARDSQRRFAYERRSHCTVEDMRTGDQHHAGTESDHRCCMR